MTYLSRDQVLSIRGEGQRSDGLSVQKRGRQTAQCHFGGFDSLMLVLRAESMTDLEVLIMWCCLFFLGFNRTTTHLSRERERGLLASHQFIAYLHSNICLLYRCGSVHPALTLKTYSIM